MLIQVANTANELDADLYDAGKQSLDTENISATGNLNIGTVIDYDARTERRTEGSHIAGDLQSAAASISHMVSNNDAKNPSGEGNGQVQSASLRDNTISAGGGTLL